MEETDKQADFSDHITKEEALSPLFAVQTPENDLRFM